VLLGPDPATVREFLARVIEVLHEATGVCAVLDVSAPSVREDGITIVISARGDLGGLSWTFPIAFARDAVRHMVPGMEPDRPLCEAVAGELANILTGRGAAVLERNGISITIAPPEVVKSPAPGTRARLATIQGPIEVVFHPSSGRG
jgi:CheY-specific phosphatase CheX